MMAASARGSQLNILRVNGIKKIVGKVEVYYVYWYLRMRQDLDATYVYYE